MDILTKLRGKVEQWEIFTVESEATKVGFEANALKSAEVEETRGVALRVVANGRLGFAASTDPSAEEELIANALESAQHGDEVPLRFPARQEGPQVAIYDERVAQLSIPQLIEMGRQVIEIIRQADPDAHVKLDLVRRISRTRVVNSAGGLAEAVKSPLELSVMVERVRDDDVLLIYDYFGTTLLNKDYLDFARHFARKLELARTVTAIQSGRMPVLFSPLGTMALVLPLVLGLNGKNVYRRISPLADKVGERLFDGGRRHPGWSPGQRPPRRRGGSPPSQRADREGGAQGLSLRPQDRRPGRGREHRQRFAPPLQPARPGALQPDRGGRRGQPGGDAGGHGRGVAGGHAPGPGTGERHQRGLRQPLGPGLQGGEGGDRSPSPATSTRCCARWPPWGARAVGSTATSSCPMSCCPP